MGLKDKAKEVLLELGGLAPANSIGWPAGYAEERKQENMVAAAKMLNDANYYREAYDLANKVSRMPHPQQNWGGNSIDEGKRLADDIKKKHPEVQLDFAVAAVPIGEHSVQVVWAPDLGGMNCDKLGKTYAAPIAVNKGLGGDYQAEVQVAAQSDGPYHKLAVVPAGQQQFTHDGAPTGKLLYYRVVIRDKQGKIAVRSFSVPCAAGKNLVVDGSFETSPVGPVPGTQPAAATQPASKKPTLALDGKGPDVFVVANGGRPFSTGTQKLTANTEPDVAAYGRPAAMDRSKLYVFGGFIFCDQGDARLCRLALDGEGKRLRVFEVAKVRSSPAWVFCVQRVSKHDSKKLDMIGNDRMPVGQESVQIGFRVAGKSAFDDVFLVEYEEVGDEVLKGLPSADAVEIDRPAQEKLSAALTSAAKPR